MKACIKEVTNINGEGLVLILTQKVSMNGGLKADQWFVSWDEIGTALFGQQYAESLGDLKKIRGEDLPDK